jgi:hypothetical protein
VARTRSARGTLSSFKYVSQTTGFTPQVDTDSQGNALIVWRTKVSPHQVIRARELTAAGALKPTQAISPGGQDAFNPQVAVNATGKAVMTWRRYDGHFWRIQARTRSPNGSLGPVKTLSSAGQNAYGPQVDINRKGKAVFVWERFVPSWHGLRVETRTLNGDGNLGPVKTLSPKLRPGLLLVQPPQVAMDANGNAYYVWGMEDDATGSHPSAWVVARKRLSSGGLAPAQNLGGDQGVNGPRVAVSGGGTATFTWTQDDYGQTSAWAVSRFPAGNLGPLWRLHPYPSHDQTPELGVGRDGNAVISWRRSGFSCDPDPDCPPVEDLVAVLRSPSGTLGPYQTLSTTGENPDVAVNGSGDAVVAWVDSGASIQAAAGP